VSAYLDPEIAACSALLEALTPLDVQARIRVLEWVKSRLIPGGKDPMALVTSTIKLFGETANAVIEHKKDNPAPSDRDKKLYSTVGDDIGVGALKSAPVSA
jgi:hypothetical protein